jgi:Glycosyl hydrolase family 12
MGHFLVARPLLAASTAAVLVLGATIGTRAARAAMGPAVSIHGTNKICGNDAHIDTVERVDIRNNDDSGAPLCLTVWYHKPNFQITTTQVASDWGAFPNAFIGCEVSVCSPHSGLPMQVSNIKTATSTWHYHPGSGRFVGNATYDIWFDPKPITSGQVDHGTEIMIWLDWKGVGAPNGTPLYIDGTWWDFTHWVAMHGGRTWNYVRFWRLEPTLKVALDLKRFFAYTEYRDLLSPAWYLTSIETGYEICRGGYGTHTLWFSASVTPRKAPVPSPAPTPTPKPTPRSPSGPPSASPTSEPTTRSPEPTDTSTAWVSPTDATVTGGLRRPRRRESRPGRPLGLAARRPTATARHRGRA